MEMVEGVRDQAVEARERWLRERRTGLGGTDTSAILGLSRYASQMDVWLDKRGESVPIPDNPRMWWGRALEPVIAHRYEVETGRKLWNPESTIYRHRVDDILIATPDRIVVGGEIGVEIKTAGIDRASEWGEPGSDDIPDEYVVQCCHYMMVTGFPAWDVAVLIGGNDFRVYRLKRDVSFEKTMRETLMDWWRQHIVGGVAPAMSGSRGVSSYLARKFPRETAPLIKASVEANGAADRLARARAALLEFDEERAAAENVLKSIIGDAAGVEGDGWRVSWKATKGRAVRDLAAFTERMIVAVAFMLEGPDAVENRKVAEAMVNAELDKATVEQPGARRFLFTQSKGVR